jgi:hypothetical protein
MMLRIPWLREPSESLVSVSIVAASSTSLLRMYSRLLSTELFAPKWVEKRRIITAAYALLYSFIEGELALLDFLPDVDTATKLIERCAKGDQGVDTLSANWKKLLDLAGTWLRLVGEVFSSSCRPVGDGRTKESETSEGGGSLFDYTLPE